MRGLRQILSVTAVNLRSLPDRLGSSLAAIFGILGVVLVLVGVLSIARGFEAAMTRGLPPENFIVLRSGSDTEMMSNLTREDVNLVRDSPEVAQANDQPLASGEVFVVINLPLRSTGTDANIPLRGVEPAAFEVRQDFHVLEGRRLNPGKNELMVGRGAAAQFAGMQVGNAVRIGSADWEVVGVFEAGGGVAESEIWTDTAILQDAYRRGSSFQAVYGRLKSAEAFEAFKNELTTNPRLNVKVMRQEDYYAEQSEMLSRIITVLGYLIAVLMALGASFGAMNTMYTTVANRTREIATLRALGFGTLPVVIAVLLESLFLALFGGLLGALLAWALFDGYQTATLNWQSFSQVAFAFQVSPTLFIQGILFAALIGMLGGLFPAIRAARLPVAQALREN